MEEFFDTHAHLDFPDFHEDLPEVIQRASDAGISRILTIGTTLDSSRRVVELAERYASVYAVVGVHPNHVMEEPDEITGPLRELAAHPRVVAIGETGMDYHRLDRNSAADSGAIKARQRRFFVEQLELAATLNLNCVIHQRDAFADTLGILSGFRGAVAGVYHCFTGTPQEAVAVLESGGWLSFTGVTTFRNAQNVRDALAAVPLGRFMLETDCPFLAPVPHRGRRCEPAHVRELAETVAVVKGCSLIELSAATCTAARAFFRRLV
jgi:TatD DNase family protein